MEKNKTGIILLIIAVVAFLLRWYLMPSHLFFGPEQGRDFLVIKDIVVNHKPTLIGSKTDVASIFHGPIYYYLAAIAFALSHGDPVAVLAFFIAIQSVSVLLAYQLTFELTGKRRSGYIAAVVFAVSYLLVVYSRWLSNPPLSVPLSLAFMLCLLRFIRGKPWYLMAAAIAYGLLGQAEFINFLLFGVIGALTVLMYRKRFITIKSIIVGTALFLGFIASFATYILFDMRHGFLISKAVGDLIQGKGGYQVYLLTSTIGAFRVLMEQAAQIIGLSGWLAGLAVTIPVMLVWYKRVRRDASFTVLAFWIWVPPVIFALLRHGMLDQLYAGVVSGFVILFAIAIDWLWEQKASIGVASLAIVVGINVYAAGHNLSGNEQVFFQPQQPGVRYTDQLKVIDWVYGRAGGRPFEFQAYTIPYFWQDAWIYLFDEYGAVTYGYKPTAVDRKLLYVIVQKDGLDPLFQKNWYDKTVSTWGVKTTGTAIGEYSVEERVPEVP